MYFLPVSAVLALAASRWARVVGYALHNNPSPQTIPSHRVVNREGRVAEGFVFGGGAVQRQLLESEGVVFDLDNRIDLTKYGINDLATQAL